MGGAIAGALCRLKDMEVTISNPTRAKLEALKRRFPKLNVTTDNTAAARAGDVVVLAVKPWIVESVVAEIRGAVVREGVQLVSIAAGVTPEKISAMLGDSDTPIYYAIPNTALSVGQSMTFIAPRGAGDDQLRSIVDMFAHMGRVAVVAEKDIPACMALASCGIAYAMRYARASVEGGVELGIAPAKALDIVLQTMVGAAELLRATGGHPEAEIDKVTTPGGLTIRGLNAMEEAGFSTAVVKGLKASV